MMQDGEWSEMGPQAYEMRVADLLHAKAHRELINGVDVWSWIGVLNQQEVVRHHEWAYVQGYLEMLMVDALQRAKIGYSVIKRRAPTSSDIHPDGAWTRWKQRQQGNTLAEP